MANARPPIVNIDDVLADPALSDTTGPRGAFEAKLGLIGKALGTLKIGINVTVVPAGKRAWPRHYHYANDELFIVLEGTGTLRYGDHRHQLRAGDVVHIAAGTGIPFQIQNTSATELKYLALSTLLHPDVFVYPDSDKIGFMAGGGPMREAVDPTQPKLVRFIKADVAAGYWDGEPDA